MDLALSTDSIKKSVQFLSLEMYCNPIAPDVIASQVWNNKAILFFLSNIFILQTVRTTPSLLQNILDRPSTFLSKAM